MATAISTKSAAFWQLRPGQTSARSSFLPTFLPSYLAAAKSIKFASLLAAYAPAKRRPATNIMSLSQYWPHKTPSYNDLLNAGLEIKITEASNAQYVGPAVGCSYCKFFEWVDFWPFHYTNPYEVHLRKYPKCHVILDCQQQRQQETRKWDDLRVGIRKIQESFRRERRQREQARIEEETREKTREQEQQQAEQARLLQEAADRIEKARQEAFACRRCPAKFPSNTKLHKHVEDHHVKKPTASPTPPSSPIPNIAEPTPPATPKPTASEVSPKQAMPTSPPSSPPSSPIPSLAAASPPAVSTPRPSRLPIPIARLPPTPPPTPPQVSISRPQKKTYMTVDDLFRMFAERSKPIGLYNRQSRRIFSLTSGTCSHRTSKTSATPATPATPAKRQTTTQTRITSYFSPTALPAAKSTKTEVLASYHGPAKRRSAHPLPPFRLSLSPSVPLPSTIKFCRFCGHSTAYSASRGTSRIGIRYGRPWRTA